MLSIFSIICHGPWTNSSRKAESLFTKRFHLGATCKRGNFLGPFSCINILNFIQYFFFSGFDLVINCTGMGAQKLCHDSNMSPVRGQVIRVKAPWQKFCVFADNDTYVIPGTFSLNIIIFTHAPFRQHHRLFFKRTRTSSVPLEMKKSLFPGMDSVTLGGCRQFGNHQPNIDEDDQKAIWRRVTRLMPNLKKAQFVADGVGLRPHRTSIRVEKEMMTLSNGSILHVVHHYGHCGYGWIVSPGSAITASQLAREILQSVEPREGGNWHVWRLTSRPDIKNNTCSTFQFRQNGNTIESVPTTTKRIYHYHFNSSNWKEIRTA